MEKRNKFRSLFGRFRDSEEGNLAVIFALAIIPLLGFVGAAVDYSRGGASKVSLQNALDSAVLAGATDQTSNWSSTALNVFNANVVSKGATVATPIFTVSNSKYAGSVTATLPTTFLSLVSVQSITINAQSTAMSARPATAACILALDIGKPLSDQGITFNGSPSVDMTGCTIRSNTSLSCGGHSIGTVASIASGSASGCTSPQSNASITPDIYKKLANNISPVCGSSKPGGTWSPGSPPLAATLKTVIKATYTEYHICGDLSLSGSGSLFGSAPNTDSVIIIENGSLTVESGANISALRTAIVLTGDNNTASSVNFPNGNGQSATLSISPPTDASTPWHGVSLYQDPSLTNRIDDVWGPGATLIADGVIYLPNANVTMKGIANSNNVGCTVLVAGTFTSNGNVSLKQTASGCATLRVDQYTGSAAYLTQ
jgi:Flp pilus assembly protein TadG